MEVDTVSLDVVPVSERANCLNSSVSLIFRYERQFMFSETEKVNSVPFSPEVEEDRMMRCCFFLLSLSLCVFRFNNMYTIGLSDDDVVRHFYETNDEMMEKSDVVKQFTRGDL